MATFTLTEARNRHGEVFDLASVEPVALTKQGRHSHVILSAAAYQKLMDRLEELEDQVLGEAAMKALATEDFVGSEKFTEELKKMIDAEA